MTFFCVVQLSKRNHLGLLLLLDHNGVQTLDGSNLNWLNVREELLSSVLLLVSSSRDSDTESEWNTLDTSLPDLLVELWVNSDVRGTELLLSELLDLLDSLWSFLLERDTVELVYMLVVWTWVMG